MDDKITREECNVLVK